MIPNRLKSDRSKTDEAQLPEFLFLNSFQLIASYFIIELQPSGTICLSILNEEDGWRPAITIKQMLLGIQDLLDNPNDKSPAQREAYELFVRDKVAYRKKIKEQAARNVPDS